MRTVYYTKSEIESYIRGANSIETTIGSNINSVNGFKGRVRTSFEELEKIIESNMEKIRNDIWKVGGVIERKYQEKERLSREISYQQSLPTEQRNQYIINSNANRISQINRDIDNLYRLRDRLNNMEAAEKRKKEKLQSIKYSIDSACDSLIREYNSESTAFNNLGYQMEATKKYASEACYTLSELSGDYSSEERVDISDIDVIDRTSNHLDDSRRSLNNMRSKSKDSLNKYTGIIQDDISKASDSSMKDRYSSMEDVSGEIHDVTDKLDYAYNQLSLYYNSASQAR